MRFEEEKQICCCGYRWAWFVKKRFESMVSSPEVAGDYNVEALSCSLLAPPLTAVKSTATNHSGPKVL